MEIIQCLCFGWCNRCRRITFEEGSRLKKLEYAAFAYTSLCEIEIPASVELIEPGIVKNTDVRAIHMAPGSAITKIPPEMFAYLDGLLDIVIPKGVEVLGKLCFKNCMCLESVVFEEGSRLRRIMSKVFARTSVHKLEIPASVEFIDVFAFGNAPITSLAIAPGNMHYRIDGPFILSFDGKTLLVYQR